MKESEVIRAFFKGQIIPDDDCHFIPPHTLVTTDSLVEGTHFLHTWSNPTQLAEKLIEVNVSDIVASGGTPNICFLNLGLSDLSKQDSWVTEFSSAFRRRLKAYRMKLVGGDTFYSQTTHLTLTVFGKCKKPWTRSGGRTGDYLYLTGQIGDSELGLHCLKNNANEPKFQKAIAKHLTPRSRNAILSELSKYEVHACMDVTDGLIQDSERLALASGGTLQITMNDLPVSPLALEILGWDAVLGSGEELELLFLSKAELPRKINNVQVRKIGFFQKKKTSLIKQKVSFALNGENYLPKQIGYSHFK